MFCKTIALGKWGHRRRAQSRRMAPSKALAALAALAVACSLVVGAAAAQAQTGSSQAPSNAQSGDASNTATDGWTTGTRPSGPSPDPFAIPGLVTTVRPASPEQPATGEPPKSTIQLSAHLTAEQKEQGQVPITRGVVWRVFAYDDAGGSANTRPTLIMTRREPTPTLTLKPGRYAVNAAYGRAYLTEMVRLQPGRQHAKSFILNAGGLRVITRVADGSRPPSTARYDIYSDERDQSGDRRRIVSNARPGLITRLNSGIYHIVSRLGDANAMVSSDVAIEAGKLTEAVVSHEAAKVTFKLVRSPNGEALADAQWIIMTRSGDIVKETAGALPSHVLAPGSYSVSARWSGQLFTRTFDIASGDNVEVEVVMQ